MHLQMDFDEEGFQLNPHTGQRFKFRERIDGERVFWAYRMRKDGARIAQFRSDASNKQQTERVRRDKVGPLRTFPNVRTQLLCDARHRARTKQLPFDLTSEWVTTELQKAIDSGDVVLGSNGNGSASARAPSIDRILPRLGYTQANCRIVPLQLNVAKGPWDDESFLEVLGPEIDRLREAKRQKCCT
jgi:hypothetical protein